MEAPYKIPFSKTKMYLLLLANLSFLLLSTWFLISPEVFSGSATAFWVRLMGIIGLVFFGITFFFGVRMITSGKLAIEITDEGIRDESSGVAVGLIRWEDIEDFGLYSIMGNEFVLVNVRNPEYYHERARGGIARYTMRQNEKMTGTPIQLNVKSVKLSSGKLLELLRAELAFRRRLEEGPRPSLAELIRQRNAVLR